MDKKKTPEQIVSTRYRCERKRKEKKPSRTPGVLVECSLFLRHSSVYCDRKHDIFMSKPIETVSMFFVSLRVRRICIKTQFIVLQAI